MLLVYENRDKGISVEWKRVVHMPPHLHEAIEIVYVTNGNIALGVGLELYDMNEGDFAIVFPNVIHHYQVFGERENKVVFLHIDPAVLSGYLKELQTYSPENPVLKKKNMHPDVVHAINFLTKNPECNSILAQAYAQIIIAYVFTDMPMIDKKSLGSDDLIYNSVEYIAKNFRNEISLEKMALDLGVGKYVLSRMFAKTFHCNFNKYVNGVRLNYAVAALENTQDTITIYVLIVVLKVKEPLTEFSRKDIEYHRVTIGIHLLRICYCN